MISRARQYLAAIGKYFTKTNDEVENDPEILKTIFESEEFERLALNLFVKANSDQRFWNSKQHIISFLNNVLVEAGKRKELTEKILTELLRNTETNFEKLAIENWLRQRKESLEKFIKDCEDSLLERNLALNEPNISHPVNEKLRTSPGFFQPAIFSDALFIFNNPQLPQKLTLVTVAEVLQNHGDAGINKSAGKSLCKLVCYEVTRRVRGGEVDEVDVSGINKLVYDKHPDFFQDFNFFLLTNIKNKIEAFRKIYAALGENAGIFSDGKLPNLETRPDVVMRKIIAYCNNNKNQDSNEALAWRLAKAHFENCSSSNPELVTEIYKRSIRDKLIINSNVTGVRFFRPATFISQVKMITQEQIEAAKQRGGGRTGEICRILDQQFEPVVSARMRVG